MRPMIVLILSTLPCLATFADSRRNQPNPLNTLRGDDYYRFVSISSNITAFLSLSQSGDSMGSALSVILTERQKEESVFEDYYRYLGWCVDQFNPKTGNYFYRPGHFEGLMKLFCIAGPESPSWNCYSFNLNGKGGLQRIPNDHMFTDHEIETGKHRNRAARMALLESLLKGMDKLGGYEQAEIVNAARAFWICSPRPKDEDVNVSAVLDDMAKSGFLHPIAMLHLGRDKYTQEELHEIYRHLLDDSMSPEWEYYCSYVKEAVEFLKTHYIQDLETAETKLPWKKAIIDEALGRPVTPWRRDGPDQESANEVEIIF